MAVKKVESITQDPSHQALPLFTGKWRGRLILKRS